jgi:hypothetical protein
MPVPIFLAAIAVGSAAGSIFEGYQSEQLQLSQIDTQAKYTKLQYLQKTTANYDGLEKLLASQEAAASVRGIGMDSPSLNAIQRNTYNTASKQQRNLDTEEEIDRINTKYEKEVVKDKFIASIFSTVGSAATSAYAYSQAQPKVAKAGS